ncbi:nitroreductase family protein [Rhodoferax sp. PAMC 29310]|uniref:Acg family FMN-binding oxidoreductase n=1 Tax=Rhodoferax sp. PAMC 29310 TaxID=2822760 RepID=UPI001B31975F|nr:nitroreductase family protein [Rhodoferax sp. PAMC 29310]
MKRRSFMRVVGGGVIVASTAGSLGLSGCSMGMPSEAIQAWNGPGPDASPAGDVRRWLLSYALLAPHSHNLQSWLVDLRTPHEITLRCDLTRLLPQTDPLFRQIMMSHGTFLELLDLAAKEQGLRADITLFPEGAFGPQELDTRPVARIRLSPDSGLPKDPLFAAILQRHTNRNGYDLARPLPPKAWSAMADAANFPKMQFGYVSDQQADAMNKHREVAKEAWRIELTTPRTIEESMKLLRVGGSEIAQHRDGISLTDPMVIVLDRLGLFDRSHAPAPDAYATTSQLKAFNEKLDSTPAFLWINTEGNDRVTQVNAGRAYARVQLAATVQGVSMQPLSQALQEYAEQRQPYADIHQMVGAAGQGHTVQMWARVGYGAPVAPAPRRPLSALIQA